MSSKSVPTPLPASHPLINELTSLRQQLYQYQKSAHQTGIQLQGSRLEAALVKEENVSLRETAESLTVEAQVLRQHPAPPSIPPVSTQLTELSLAHRRLSAKLDLTEEQLADAQLELAASRQDITRLVKEREGDRATINDLRRVEEDREEEVEWERGERRKMEEQKKLCDLALDEYSNLVHSLDPSAVPPATPRSANLSTDILLSTPHLDTSESPLPSPSGYSVTASDSISNLLVGQRGVHQLFHDFTTTLTTKERKIHELQAKIEEMEHSFSILQEQLHTETEKRVRSEVERDKALRDDASAAKVVERYMSFSQKNAQTLHSHLDHLRSRSSATQATLRKHVLSLQNRVKMESERSERLRTAMDEMSESLSREAVGRRREVGLRLKMIASEEKRERKIEHWLDKVRRARDGSEGAVLEADALEVLLDEGIEALGAEGDPGLTKEKERKWGGKLLRRKAKHSLAHNPAMGGEDSSIARVLLAEDLVTTLVQDLQIETERRIELERQRVDWLAKEAVEGVDAEVEDVEEQQEGELVFDAEDEGEMAGENVSVVNGGADLIELSDPTADVHVEEPIHEPAYVEPSAPEPSPLMVQLKSLFEPLGARYMPLQKTLHDLSLSLASLRPVSTPSTPEPMSPTTRTKKSVFLSLSRKSSSSDTIFVALLDGIHEVIEDARVDVEIGIADEERVYAGFEALLGVGGPAEKRGQVIRDAKEYIKDKMTSDVFVKLSNKVDDLEHDLALLKRTLHEVEEGIEIYKEKDEDEETPSNGDRKPQSVWQTIPLRTVQPPTSYTRSFSTSPMRSPSLASNGSSGFEFDPRKRTASTVSMFSNVGRSFSASVISAPRRVGGLATGLYRNPAGGKVASPTSPMARREEEDVE
ncbi:hypothetical protein P7C73_g1473, partial [Tremellales sp. Uapishka_1]